jgi:alpha-D-ribose 1-methylphosphonate 5-triphosphate synthase subunit PhnG
LLRQADHPLSALSGRLGAAVQAPHRMGTGCSSRSVIESQNQDDLGHRQWAAESSTASRLMAVIGHAHVQRSQLIVALVRGY